MPLASPPHPADHHHGVLDLRGLPAPEPMLRALAAVDALGPGEAVELFTPLLPTPLLDLLAGRRLHVHAEALPAGGARVRVHRPDDDGPTRA